jgi:AcrR family transcriptional regulator
MPKNSDAEELRRGRKERPVPTGVHIRDAREQLFAAAERVLLRDGPNALTSRAVTAEAGVAKGVLHRHFADFDTFIVELMRDRVSRIELQGAALLEAAGTGTVAGNLTGALTDLFGSIAMSIVALVIFRDDLRIRLREEGLGRLPVLTQGVAMIRAYLTAERDLGRIAAGADIDTIGLTLTGSGHLLFADLFAEGNGAERAASAIEEMVASVLAGATAADRALCPSRGDDSP